MPDRIVFLKGFLRNPIQVSSIVPTSARTAKRLARRIRPGSNVIVEFGPGTGVLARAILQSGSLQENGFLILIEKSPVLAEHLRTAIRDPRVKVVHDSAENVEMILGRYGVEYADYIFSSIPLTIMPRHVSDAIISASLRVLNQDGLLVIFLCNPRIRSILLRHVRSISMHLEPLNFPPLFVWQTKKKAARV